MVRDEPLVEDAYQCLVCGILGTLVGVLRHFDYLGLLEERGEAAGTGEPVVAGPVRLRQERIVECLQG